LPSHWMRTPAIFAAWDDPAALRLNGRRDLVYLLMYTRKGTEVSRN
jgi:hypothetical protein